MMNLVMKRIVEYCQCIPFDFDGKLHLTCANFYGIFILSCLCNILASVLSVDNFPACSWGRLTCVYDSLGMAF